MIRHKQRVTLFQKAIDTCVSSNDVVVEIGTGLGTYSFFAVKSGARRVYAIEENDIIRVARELARKNKLSERITFVQGDSTEVVLKEKGDVLIFEDFSSFFLGSGLEELMQDALKRHITEEAIVIPQAAFLYVAPVENAKLWSDSLILENDGFQSYGLDFGILRKLMLNRQHSKQTTSASLLSGPVMVQSIDLKQTQSYLFDEIFKVKMNRCGTLHGLLGWFDLKLIESVYLSNAPSNPESTWGQVFFPFSMPLPVRRNETVTLRLACSRSRAARDVWWTWQGSTRLGLAENSSFQGVSFSVDDLRGREPDRRLQVRAG